MFFRRGCTRLLLYFNTNKPHSFLFLQNTSCIRKPQVIWGGAHPLHPPPRSAPEGDKRNHCQLSRIVRVLHSSPCPPYRSPNLPDKTEFLTLLLSLEFCAIFQKFKNAFDHRTVSTAFFISTFQKIYKFRRLRSMS